MSAIFGTKFDTVVAFEWPRHSHPNVGQLIFVGPRDRLVSDNVRLNGVLFSSQGLTKERLSSAVVRYRAAEALTNAGLAEFERSAIRAYLPP